MKAYIECIEDTLMDHSTIRYAKLIITIPEKEGGDYQKYHLGECEILQGNEVNRTTEKKG
jgi:hypothetical protein